MKADLILQRASYFCKLAQELSEEEALPPKVMPLPPTSHVRMKELFYRVQPKGKELKGHTSNLGSYQQVPGVFAFQDPQQLFDTATWLHVRKNLPAYEMITFTGTEVERPADSEGIVVEPHIIVSREPMTEWVKQHPPSFNG